MTVSYKFRYGFLNPIIVLGMYWDWGWNFYNINEFQRKKTKQIQLLTSTDTTAIIYDSAYFYNELYSTHTDDSILFTRGNDVPSWLKELAATAGNIVSITFPWWDSNNMPTGDGKHRHHQHQHHHMLPERLNTRLDINVPPQLIYNRWRLHVSSAFTSTCETRFKFNK